MDISEHKARLSAPTLIERAFALTAQDMPAAIEYEVGLILGKDPEDGRDVILTPLVENQALIAWATKLKRSQRKLDGVQKELNNLWSYATQAEELMEGLPRGINLLRELRLQVLAALCILDLRVQEVAWQVVFVDHSLTGLKVWWTGNPRHLRHPRLIRP